MPPDPATGCFVATGALYPGLALSCCVRMARRGVPVAILHRHPAARPEAQVQAVKAEIEGRFRRNGWPLSIHRVSYEKPAALEDVLSRLAVSHGALMGVLFGEGTNAYPVAPVTEFAREDWSRALSMDFLAYQAVFSTALQVFRKQGHGRFVTFSFCEPYWDVNSRHAAPGVPAPNNLPFVTNKRLVQQHMRDVFLALLDLGVTANVIELGAVRKSSLVQILDGDGEEGGAKSATEADVACLVEFLLSRAAGRISGATIPVLSRLGSWNPFGDF